VIQLTLSWRDAAAIWGAMLSTVMAVMRLLPSRPRFHVEPGEQPISDLTIRVANPSKGMCFVRELWRLPFPGTERPLGVYTGKTPMADVGATGSLWIAVKSESEVAIIVNCMDERSGPKNRWLLVFGWQGSWFVPTWAPVPVFISTKRAKRLNAAK
jgi:hypothetical protein